MKNQHKMITKNSLRKGNTECCSCGKSFYKRPGVKKGDKAHYCSNFCLQTYRFTWLGFVFENATKIPRWKLAEIIGVNFQTFKSWIVDYRKAGVKIPYYYKPEKKKPPKRVKPVRWLKVKPVRPPKEKKHHQSMQKAPKPEVKKYATKQVDMSQYHYVRLDSKTIVLRKKTA